MPLSNKGFTDTRFTDKADITALLGAFCFFLSAVEYMLPKPLPFMRLGIANLPILLAVDILPFQWFIVLAIVKVIGMSLISGTLFSYIALFSLAGTIVAALIMWGARRAGGSYISQIGVSVLGAVASNFVQILIARFVVFREAAWLIAPLFLGMGLLTGMALGFFAEHFAHSSVWYARASGRDEPDLAATGAGAAPASRPAATGTAAGGFSGGIKKLFRPIASFFKPYIEALQAKKEARSARSLAARNRRKAKMAALFSPDAMALAGLAIMIAFLWQKNLVIKMTMLIFFAAAAWAMGKRFSLVTSLSVTMGIVIANLIVPSGRVLFTVGTWRITQGALREGIGKAITFEGLMFLSKACIMPGLKLPGPLGGIVAAAFTYYDRIIEYKGKIRAATLARDADDLMLRVWESAEPAAKAEGRSSL